MTDLTAFATRLELVARLIRCAQAGNTDARTLLRLHHTDRDGCIVVASESIAWNEHDVALLVESPVMLPTDDAALDLSLPVNVLVAMRKARAAGPLSIAEAEAVGPLRVDERELFTQFDLETSQAPR